MNCIVCAGIISLTSQFCSYCLHLLILYFVKSSLFILLWGLNFDFTWDSFPKTSKIVTLCCSFAFFRCCSPQSWNWSHRNLGFNSSNGFSIFLSYNVHVRSQIMQMRYRGKALTRGFSCLIQTLSSLFLRAPIYMTSSLSMPMTEIIFFHTSCGILTPHSSKL